MSKIIEALKVRSSARPDEGAPVASAREISIEKSVHELTQEQLADIYFSATGKAKTSETPVIIKITERPRSTSWIPWMIAAVAFLITALSLFSTKRLFIEVKVLDEKGPFVRSLENQKNEEGADVSTKAGSLAHKIPVKDFLFEGAAYLNSSKDKTAA